MNRFRKSKIMLLAALMVAAMLLTVVGCGGGDEEAYRQIQIYRMDGSAVVEREQTGEIAAYEDMFLQSGDRLKVASDSFLYLELDGDKYLLLEPDTQVLIEAEGDETDSRTKISLEQGAIVNCIENPLSENSYYEIQTPNATMAVRGTVFRIALGTDEGGEYYTDVSVYEGEVECFAPSEDGSDAELIAPLPAGNRVRIGKSGEQQGDITPLLPEDYEALPANVTEFLDENGYALPEQTESPEPSEQAEHVHDENCGYVEAVPCSHVHDESCGYAEAVAGSPCTHVHNAACGYSAPSSGSACTHFDHDGACGWADELPYIACDHVEHNDYCGYVEGVPGVACDHFDHDGNCGYFGPDGVCMHEVGIHDDTCSYVAEIAAVPCSHSLGEHDWTCSYQEAQAASPCCHTLGIHDEYCGYIAPFAGTPCRHSHDATCGYVAAVTASPCTHTHDESCGYVEGSPCMYDGT
ncbi:MAG: FecR family protein [Clostridia bacterium]|nr:FecR family protein [Clostridia bacterium]